MSEHEPEPEYTGSLRPMYESDLAEVLAWRNSDRVRSSMYTQENIPFEVHKRWFHRKQDDKQSTLMIFSLEGVDCGYLSLAAKPLESRVEWGFYTSPHAAKGTGMLLGQAGVRYVFNTLSMHKLAGQVLEHNTPSLKFHERLGFRQEGVLRDHHVIDSRYVSSVYFGLLREEWLQMNETGSQPD